MILNIEVITKRDIPDLVDKILGRIYTIDGVEDVRLTEATTGVEELEPVNKYCCHLCFNKSGQMFLDRMILCPECGNKRCPKATHHDLPCTKSNDLGQKGSIYDQPAQQQPVAWQWKNTMNFRKTPPPGAEPGVWRPVYTSSQPSKPCEWQREDDVHMPDTWRSDCGVMWTFTDGGPVDNDMKYCCGCGAKLVEKKS